MREIEERVASEMVRQQWRVVALTTAILAAGAAIAGAVIAAVT